MADEHLISLQPGTVIAGKYEVVKCLGQGSMGLVYACRHRELSGHLVAVKVLFPEVAQDKVAAARFRNEIFASYGVSHPNVVRAYEFIRDGDLVAYTMEYVGGGDLADRLSRHEQQPMEVSEIIRVLAQMCLGVQAIHDAGIVHRDLKPENILLTREGVVKIADFGIAKAGHGPKLTEHGGVVGTIDYVSPEYMLNAQVDWRSDIYAIGILGYEMITGKSPFRGESVYATMTKRLKSDPAAPSAMRPECPQELDKIVLRAMHRDPEQRYQAAAEMFQDLERIMSEEDLAVVPQSAIAMTGVSRAGSARPSETRPSPAWKAANPAARQQDHEEASGTQGLTIQGGRVRSNSASDARWGSDRPTQGGFSAGPAGHFGGFEREYSRPTMHGPIVERFDDGDAEMTIHEPLRMERVLSHTNAISDTWDSEFAPHEVRIPQGGGIDTQRMRKLSKQAETSGNGRLFWLDVLTLVVAIVIGIGVGFAMLNIFAPHLLRDIPGEADETGPMAEVKIHAPLELPDIALKKSR